MQLATPSTIKPVCLSFWQEGTSLSGRAPGPSTESSALDLDRVEVKVGSVDVPRSQPHSVDESKQPPVKMLRCDRRASFGPPLATEPCQDHPEWRWEEVRPPPTIDVQDDRAPADQGSDRQ